MILRKILHKFKRLSANVELKILKKRAEYYGFEIKSLDPVKDSEIVIENFFKTSHQKHALLSYIVYPFITEIKNYHSNNRECFVIAQILDELEFNVDIIHWDNTTYTPNKTYSLVIDNHNNLERLLPHLAKNACKIFHATNAHWLYQNWVEYGRYYEFFLQKGISIAPPRIMTQGNSAEYSDFISIFGNDFTKKTFGTYASKTHQLPMSVTVFPKAIEEREYSTAKLKFVWLNSHGALLKGLDVVINAFTKLPNLELYICGDLERDALFKNAMKEELSHSSNIKVAGWVDVEGDLFKKIVSECAWVLSTSFSEGGGGSILNCMAKGLIPVITRSVSLTLPDNTGFYLENNDEDDLVILLDKISILPESQLKSMSVNACQFVQTNHTIEKFKSKYKEFLVHVLSGS